MISVAEHLARVRGLAPRLAAETVPLGEALGRVIAADAVAALHVPPFENSAMDGYAMRSADVAGAAVLATGPTLRLVGRSAAGHPYDGVVEPGTAVRILTGAAMPRGADAVVPQERVVVVGGRIEIAGTVAAGDHVRRVGEDARPGDIVVPAGTRLAARHLAALAATGVVDVAVVVRPRVRVIVTGDELTPVGESLGPGRIVESNGVLLGAALTGLGVAVEYVGPVADDPAEVWREVSRPGADAVVTTGGASVGDADAVKEALAPRGVVFENVAMQPGKPQGAGLVDGVPILCLPGNPVAVAVSMELFVEALVAGMLGTEVRPWLTAPAGASWSTPSGRAQFMPIVWRDGTVVPATDAGSGSHLAGRFARAEGLAWVPAEVARVEPGEIVAVRPLGT